jgi:predicted MFS family arabinose efflux permease
VAQWDRTVADMSTLTSKRSRSKGGVTPRARIISGPLALVFLSTFGTLTSFYLLLSVTPIYAAGAGAGSAGAGLVTGVLLLGTVAAELASSMLMRRYGYRIVLAAGAVLLGVPTLALLSRGSLAVIVAVSAVRGVGFGLSTVVTGAMIAALVPPDRRGEGFGLAGVAETVPGVVALPGGVWLAGHAGSAVVVGLTAAAALLPLAAFAWLPGGRDRAGAEAGADRGHAAGLLAALRQGGLRRPALIFAASTMSAGVVASFLPLAAGVSAGTATAGLLAQALTAAIGSWWAGRRGDRHGHARLLVPGLAVGSLGMTAMIWLTSPAAAIAGMCVFGFGFGISENATFTLMIKRASASGLGTASALWSLAYDTGYGAGPAAFGLVVGHTGYPAAFAMTGVLMLVALPIARRERAAQGSGRRDGQVTVTPTCSPPAARSGVNRAITAGS